MAVNSCKITAILILGIGIITGCSHSEKNKKADPAAKGKIAVLRGKKLAKQYCSSCHLSVPPDYLNKKTWVNGVLPVMAEKMGIGVYGRKQYFPKKGSMVSIPEWFDIVAYFKAKAPQKLNVPADEIALLDTATSLFSIEKPKWNGKLHNIATTTLVSYDSLNHRLYTSDAISKKTYSWSNNLTPTFLPKLPIGAVQVFFYKDSSGNEHGVFTDIGSMKQVNKATGKVINYNFSKNEKQIIAGKLARPVFALPGDFNRDGLRDWVVGAFGHTIGGLYLYEQQQSNSMFKKRVVRDVPGAIDAKVEDFNHDGWPDIMVLFAQGDESIRLFVNDKKGGFNQRVLLRFPPVYGSNSFQLADFNNDGKPDILYAAGDNADYSAILKPYHGIYIFINEGNYHYKKTYFYHINGATKAVAADYDQDGDLDIAVISFFADLKGNTHSTFIYFEQNKLMHFMPSAPAQLYKMGRWVSMDVADVDNDGDRDILLGNYSRGLTTGQKIKTSWNSHLPFVLLKNRTNILR